MPWPRLASLVIMLVLLVSVMHRFSQMGQSDDEQTASTSAAAPATSPFPASPPAEPVAEPPPSADPDGLPPALVGTDLDPEQQDAIREEFQAVDDRSLFNLPREMPAYLRLVGWAKKQSVEQMSRRARRDILFGQFIQQPDKYRGQLVDLNLNVARILKYDDRTADGDQLYEVWAWVNESKGWLYVAVVVDLPAGTPIGNEVSFKARFSGYFYKLQGYQAAKARPGDPPLIAPAFIGRLLPLKSAPAPGPAADWFWVGAALAAVVLAMLAWQAGTLLFRARRRVSEALPPMPESGDKFEHWLDQQAQTDSSPEDDEVGASRDRPDRDLHLFPRRDDDSLDETNHK